MFPTNEKDITIRYPASYAQQAVWFHHRLFSVDTLYNLLWQVNFSGTFYPAKLRHSLQEIVDRHDVFRTCFSEDENGLHQNVRAFTEVDYPLEDFLELSDDEKTTRFSHLVKEMASTVFDLKVGPLFRFCLVRLSSNEHSFLVLMHHLVMDGTSWPVFVHELITFYEGKPLPTLPLKYGEYAARQKETFESGSWKPHQEFWHNQLAELPPLLELPTANIRPTIRNFCSGIIKMTIAPALTSDLKSLAKQNGSSLFKVLLATFVLFLHRITSENTILVGTTLTGRSSEELAGLIGFFVNTSVLRTNIEGGIQFLELLQRIHCGLEEVVLHQEYPFEKVVQLVNPVRDLSREPLISTSFTKLPSSGEKRIVGLVVTEERLFPDLSIRDLSVYSQETTEGIWFTCEYDNNLFDADTINRFLECYKTLLTGIISDPSQLISELPFLPTKERKRILVDWNDTNAKFSDDKCIHQLFEEQVERTPDNVAVIWKERRLTYRELNEKANHLAFILINKGVVQKQFVPVLALQGIPLIISELAIMKAGAAFVPIDTGWPEARIKHLLNELGNGITLSGSSEAELLKSIGQEIIIVDEKNLPGAPSNPLVKITPSDPIYVMYTSGSTGEPKGVVNKHLGIVNRFFNMNDRYGGHEDDVILMTTSHMFDSSVWQLFWPLTNGSRTVIPSHTIFDTDYIFDLIEREKVTFTDFVPSVFTALVEKLAFRSDYCVKLESLRQLIIGGEQINFDDVNRFRSFFPGVGITNAYGPTETSIGVIFYDVPIDCKAPVPIGKPLKNVHAFILDTYKNPQPVGVTGELYIGGACVGLGYINNNELIRSVFVNNPFKEINCPTLYRTGDLARYRIDGNIEFLGRSDHQVKIRGFRIELDEIEASLRQHPGVREVVVSTCEDIPGNKRLIAYIVQKTDSESPTRELRHFLAGKVPEYMIPSLFVILESLPLTANGKIDRCALPAPNHTRPELEDLFIAPRTPVEQAVADIWEELLGLDRIGAHDNFFELGGDSLLATQVISHIRNRFLTEIPLRILFEFPTIAGIAHHLTQHYPHNESNANLSGVLADLEFLSEEEAELLLGKMQPPETDSN